MDIKIIDNNIYVNEVYFAPLEKSTKIKSAVDFNQTLQDFRKHMKDSASYMIKWKYEFDYNQNFGVIAHTTFLAGSMDNAHEIAKSPVHVTADITIKDNKVENIDETSNNEDAGFQVFGFIDRSNALISRPVDVADGVYHFDTETAEYKGHCKSYLCVNTDDERVTIAYNKKFTYIDDAGNEQVVEWLDYDLRVFRTDDKYCYAYIEWLDCDISTPLRSHENIQLLAIPLDLISN